MPPGESPITWKRKTSACFWGVRWKTFSFQTGRFGRFMQMGAGCPVRPCLWPPGSVPELDLLNGSGLLQAGCLEVTPALQTRDEHIFAAGDAVTIVKDGRFTPWTWPQAAAQGKLAALNLFAPVPVPLNCLSRVNSMNLNGLPLAGLGLPVSGAQTSLYSKARRRHISRTVSS